MPDVEITYNNSTIASMSNSGAEVLETNGKLCSDDITVAYTRTNGSATTPATTITANPTISVSNTGYIIATVNKSQSVTPTVSAGYVSSGTAGIITVSGSKTYQLTTQAAQTIHPSATDQTIASGKYLTGAQTVKGVLLTNLSADNIKKDVVVKVGDSTDDDCVASVTGTYEGGGGGTTSVSFDCVGVVYYTDSDNTAQSVSSPYQFSATVPSKSLIVAFCNAVATTSLSNCTKIESEAMGTRANYRYVDIIQAD